MSDIISKCHRLIQAYKNGELGQTIMPEDTHPNFGGNQETRLSYFTLPMALNYQRNSYALRESAKKTFLDTETRSVFDVEQVSKGSSQQLQNKLLKYKLALQPNKHIHTRQTISQTIYQNRGTTENLLKITNHDFLKLQEIIQKKYKKGFPYLSGPKIFHYRSWILTQYGGIELENKQFIDIAPDTHIIQCSIKLGVIKRIPPLIKGDRGFLPKALQSKNTSEVKISKQEISERRRNILKGSGIDPIDMHAPLRFWSRNGFILEL